MKFKTLGVISIIALGAQLVSAGRLEFFPATGEFVKNCPFKVSVVIDTQGKQVGVTDARINLGALEVKDFDFSGSVFQSFITPFKLKASRGYMVGKEVIAVPGLNGQAQDVVGTGKMFDMTVMSSGNANETTLSFYYIPESLGDVSIMSYRENGETVTKNGLTEVGQGYYTFKDGPCDANAKVGEFTFYTGGKVHLITNETYQDPEKNKQIIKYTLIAVGIVIVVIGTSVILYKKRKIKYS